MNLPRTPDRIRLAKIEITNVPFIPTAIESEIPEID